MIVYPKVSHSSLELDILFGGMLVVCPPLIYSDYVISYLFLVVVYNYFEMVLMKWC